METSQNGESFTVTVIHLFNLNVFQAWSAKMDEYQQIKLSCFDKTWNIGFILSAMKKVKVNVRSSLFLLASFILSKHFLIYGFRIK